MQCRNSLKDGGIYLVTMPSLTFLFESLWTSIASTKHVKNSARDATLDDLKFFNELFKEGKLRTVIDKRYQLQDIVEAFKYVERGHKKGNVVITIT